MKPAAWLGIAALASAVAPAGAQTFSKDGNLLMPAEARNTAAAQVAVAQARLYGSVLMSYRPGASPEAPARLVVATRRERLTIEVDPVSFQLRQLRRETTRGSFLEGMVVCRSYAPIDAILADGRRRFGSTALEVIPPHKPGEVWRTRVGLAVYDVRLDDDGRARFVQRQLSR